jgi:hypothetical protein
MSDEEECRRIAEAYGFKPKAQPAQGPDAPSDTPRTDAALKEHYDGGDYFGEDTTREAYDFARRLERERDEARKLAEECQMWHPGRPEIPWKVDKLDNLD